MASRPLSWVVVVVALVTTACSAGERRFPLREPMWTDTDTRPVKVSCRAEPTKKDPQHIACAPTVYVSPLVWDGVDNFIFRPLSELFAVEASREAVNANSPRRGAGLRVVHEPRGRARADRRGARPGRVPPDADPHRRRGRVDASWIIDKGKDNGSSPGFRVKILAKGDTF